MASDHSHGVLIIPDISGFTQFVNEVEISHSEHIITDLLGMLIDENQLNLELCEIEGDALFFYRRGDPPSMDELNDQVNKWITEFHTHLKLLQRDVYCNCGACQNIGKLGLKVIGHFGEFAVYSLKNKTKIIGRDVILVHRMLKNSLNTSEYVLLSKNLLEKTGLEENSNGFSDHTESYDIIGDVKMAYLDLSHVRDQIPPPKAEDIPKHEGEITSEVHLDHSLQEVAAVVSNIAGWPEWVAGVERVILDESAPIQAGHHHRCVFPDMELGITVEQIREDGKDFVMYEDVTAPPGLKCLKFLHRIIPAENGVTYRGSYLYDKKFLSGHKFERNTKQMLIGQLAATVDNLKEYMAKKAAQ